MQVQTTVKKNRRVNLVNERIGTIGYTKNGSRMEVVEYKAAGKIVVKFDEGHTVSTIWQNFCSGSVKNPMEKTKFGIGWIGIGRHKVSENRKLTPAYESWTRMFLRSYGLKGKEPEYTGVTVDPRWHCFQDYADWYEENFYQIEGERMDLDKDIMIPGSKVYSPETCVFVPMRLNLQFRNSGKKRKFKKNIEKIKSIANELKGCLPSKLYNALMTI
ncbi:MAG: hypothetical protein ACQET8_22595 [Bacillota bacterium]